MVMKKVALTVLLTCPWVAFADQADERFAQQQQQVVSSDGATIDELRKRCLAARSDTQIKEFENSIACSGSYTFWEERKVGFRLPNLSHMTANLDVKGGRYSVIPHNSSAHLAMHDGQCSVWDKRRMAVPAGTSLPFNIHDCNDLTEQNIYRICKDAVIDYCAGNFDVAEVVGHQQQQQQQQRADGKCTLTTIDHKDVCPK